MYLIGFDIGSSSIKASLVDSSSGKTIMHCSEPPNEMDIASRHPTWAEQEPENWWKHLCVASKNLIQNSQIDAMQIKGIGIAYQMHGLVIVNEKQEVLRPAIIWCDSRATQIGKQALKDLGKDYCLNRLLNGPGNFTLSKLRWVKENEPDVYANVHKFMLPGDFIAMKLSGKINTTVQGMSEGIAWDFVEHGPAKELIDYYELDEKLIPEILPSLSEQGRVTEAAAAETGLEVGTPICYRGGDQPNNAMSLNVLNPGEIAATGGTSGVVYAISDQLVFDPLSRVNSFAHINHQENLNRIGVLLCINGAGITYRWLRQQMANEEFNYEQMESLLSQVPIGSNGLRIYPFGNGAERMLENQNLGARFYHVNFNQHKKEHFFRAALEGVAFSFIYGMNILKDMGIKISVIKVGNDNLFQSKVFSETVSALSGAKIHVLKTNGATGAAKAAGVVAGIFKNLEEAFKSVEVSQEYKVLPKQEYTEVYTQWEQELNEILKSTEIQ